MTEDAEFREIYKLPVVAIPPNRPVARKDEDDLIYRTVEAKFNAVADDVAERNKAGPALPHRHRVHRELPRSCRALLDKRGIKHETLNAKNHEREAHIIAQAGPRGRRDHRHEHGRPRQPTSCWAATPTCWPTTCCASAGSIRTPNL